MNVATQPLTLGELLADAQQRLAAHSESAQQDAQVLLAKIIGRRRWWVLAHSKDLLGQPQRGRWEAALARLEAGEPLPYVLGEWEFYGLKFHVTPDVLIPRPETELLVETALAWLAANPARRRVADVGTGCGCIAVALAVNVADLHITASDVSEAALEVAKSNVERYHLQERVELVKANLLDGSDSPFDLICANLPYIPSTRVAELAVARYEPHVALFAGADGLELIGGLLEQARAKLAPGGLLLAEIDDSQEKSAPELARRNFPNAQIDVLRDLAGKPRIVRIEAHA
jgi:release factor glutamine methyltransferase